MSIKTHKWLSIFCCLFLISSFALGGCGKTASTSEPEEVVETEPQEATTAPETTEPVKIVMARVAGDPFYKTVECAAIEEAKKLGVDLQIQSLANFEIAEQTRVLDAIIQTKPDVIITAPVDANGVIPVFKRAKEAGIIMVGFDTTLADKSLVGTEIVTDNYEQGVLAADALAKAIGEKGKVFVLSAMPGLTTTDQEQEGFEEQIAKYPDIEYLGTEFHNQDQNRGVSIVNSILQAHPDLEGIFTTTTFGSQAAVTALREAKKIGEVKVIGYDTTEEIIQGLKDGVFVAVLAYEARQEGILAVDAAVKLARGESVEEIYTVGNKVLTIDNVDDPENLGLRYVSECP